MTEAVGTIFIGFEVDKGVMLKDVANKVASFLGLSIKGDKEEWIEKHPEYFFEQYDGYVVGKRISTVVEHEGAKCMEPDHYTEALSFCISLANTLGGEYREKVCVYHYCQTNGQR